MKKPLRKLSVLLTAAALTVALAGCSEAEQARLERFCQQNGISDCHLFVPGAAAPTPVTPSANALTLTAVDPSNVPASLAEWAAAMRNAEETGSQVLVEGNQTLIAIAGGLQSSGGYRIEVESVTQKDGVWVVAAKVVPPDSDQTVTTALENPVGIFQAPKLNGTVQVVVTPPPQTAPVETTETESPVTVAIEAVAITSAATPEAVQKWAGAQTGVEESGSLVESADGQTYVAIAGGLRSTGGYRVEIAQIVQQGDGWLIEAKVVAPPADAMVTMAFQNPVGIFQLPPLDGAVTVQVLNP